MYTNPDTIAEAKELVMTLENLLNRINDVIHTQISLRPALLTQIDIMDLGKAKYSILDVKTVIEKRIPKEA